MEQTFIIASACDVVSELDSFFGPNQKLIGNTTGLHDLSTGFTLSLLKCFPAALHTLFRNEIATGERID